MGQICSCFSHNTGSNQTHRSEIMEIPVKISSVQLQDVIPQKEPLLQNRELTLNTKKNTLSSAQNHCNESGVCELSEKPIQPEKVQKSFYQKIQSIPQSVSAITNVENRISDVKINNLFDKYKDIADDCILSEGIERLCHDLQLKPDDFKILVLAWKLNARQMCLFTRDEFCQGLKSMNADSLRGILIKLNEITIELQDNAELFKDLYRFTYTFGLDASSGQRILPLEVAVVLWQLVFSIRTPAVLSRWLHYLEQAGHVKGIPNDTWNMFLNFCDFINDDLSNYDDTEAWPSLLDDFVEYENDQVNQNVSQDKKK